MPKLRRVAVTAAEKFYYLTADCLYAIYHEALSLLQTDKIDDYHNPHVRQKVTIVIIPGVYEPWRFMRPLFHKLFLEGYPVYVVDTLGYNSGKISDMAERVAQVIDSYKLQNVVLLAHSKGGLIGKAVLASHNQQNAVRGMVALNTPFGGSVYAYLAPVRSLRAFKPDSKDISLLKANAVVNRTITSIYSRYDPLIPVTSRLDGATNIVIDTMGHFLILKNTAAYEAIKAAISKGSIRV